MPVETHDIVRHGFEDLKLRSGFKEMGKGSVIVRPGGVDVTLL